MPNITFYGAAHEVTGSNHLVEHNGKFVLLDCGMFQGSDFNEGKNADDFPYDPKSLSAVIVSHAHLDHSGRIPKLVRDGYEGPIYMTNGTKELSYLLWKDAHNIMKYNNKKFQAPILFTEEDVYRAKSQCIGIDYGHEVQIIDDISFRLHDAGHIFGSSFVELHLGEKRLVFSGDVGNANVPILKETEPLCESDVLICESTYGERSHETPEERNELILSLIKEGVERGGVVMVPAFSLERTQELLYSMHEMHEAGLLPDFPIYLDSPLAIDALPVYKKYDEYYDKEAKEKYCMGKDFFQFPQLTITRSTDESKKINDAPHPLMVIAGAGMMNGGRIVHHLFRYLPDKKSTLIIVGYQAHGTLGRQLFDGADVVKIFGQEVPVNCTIKAIGALSAHADRDKLLAWIKSAPVQPKHVYCVHGEERSLTSFSEAIRNDLGIDSSAPMLGDTISF